MYFTATIQLAKISSRTEGIIAMLNNMSASGIGMQMTVLELSPFDEIATVGTINLDYRSLYLHFECGIYMKDTNVIKDIKKDFEDSFKESHKVDEKEAKNGLFKGLWQAILRLFAPMM